MTSGTQQHEDRPTRRPIPSARSRFYAGFTLIELMVVVVIIGILASVGLPMYTKYVLKAELNQAIPVMMAIAAKERIQFNRTGYYLGTGSEDLLQQRLAVKLSDVGDFCFMVFCTDSSKCAKGYNSDGTPSSGTTGTLVDTPDKATVTPAFQVVAVLRQTEGSSLTFASQSCAVTTSAATAAKQLPTGWVVASGSAGGENRGVVLSYPTPVDGVVSSTGTGLHATIDLDWTQGVTLSDAMVP